MLSFGTWTELLLIAVAMLILFKPEDYPKLFRALIRFYKKAMTLVETVKAPLQEMSWDMDVEEFTQRQKSAVAEKEAKNHKKTAGNNRSSRKKSR